MSFMHTFFLPSRVIFEFTLLAWFAFCFHSRRTGCMVFMFWKWWNENKDACSQLCYYCYSVLLALEKFICLDQVKDVCDVKSITSNTLFLDPLLYQMGHFWLFVSCFGHVCILIVLSFNVSHVDGLMGTEKDGRIKCKELADRWSPDSGFMEAESLRKYDRWYHKSQECRIWLLFNPCFDPFSVLL